MTSAEIREAHAELHRMGLVPLLPPLYSRSGKQKKRLHAPSQGRAAHLRRIVYVRDDFTCHLCGYRSVPNSPRTYDGKDGIPGLTLGHVVDYRLGGPYEPTNLRTECRDCNERRGVRRQDPARAEHITKVGFGAYDDSLASWNEGEDKP